MDSHRDRTVTIAHSGTAQLTSSTGVYDILTIGNNTSGALQVSGGVLSGTTLQLGSLGIGSVTVSGGTCSNVNIIVESSSTSTGAITLTGGIFSTISITAVPLAGATTFTSTEDSTSKRKQLSHQESQ